MLSARIEEARLLMEANVAKKPLLDTANHWRKFVRAGDQYLEAIQGVVDAATAAAEAEDQTTARRANSDVSGALRKVTSVTGKAYGDFASGRYAIYEVAKLFGVSTKRKSSYGKKPKTLAMMDDDALRKEIDKGARNMKSGIKKMLNLGAGASGDMRDAAKMGEDPPPELIEKLVGRGLDFRDEVSVNVFARTNGILRRAAELSRRNWELMMMEDSKLGWSAPWSRDPEIGNVEII